MSSNIFKTIDVLTNKITSLKDEIAKLKEDNANLTKYYKDIKSNVDAINIASTTESKYDAVKAATIPIGTEKVNNNSITANLKKPGKK